MLDGEGTGRMGRMGRKELFLVTIDKRKVALPDY
jgi:hypothetical protein